MAVAAKPPIFGTAIQGWRSTFEAISRMSALFITAVALMLILNAVSISLTPPPKQEPSLAIQLLMYALEIVQGLVLTPVAIAMHRFVLLGEVTQRYVLNPSDPRFVKFFLVSVAYQFLIGIPSMLMMLALKNQDVTGGILAAVFAILFFVAVFVAVRILILFPAIAVDAAGAQWRNAYRDSKGNFWRTLLILTVTMMPHILVMMPFYFLLEWPDGPGLFGGAILSVVQSIFGVASLAACAAAASLLYVAWSERLRMPLAPA
jgi:hypothetical protein